MIHCLDATHRSCSFRFLIGRGPRRTLRATTKRTTTSKRRRIICLSGTRREAASPAVVGTCTSRTHPANKRLEWVAIFALFLPTTDDSYCQSQTSFDNPSRTQVSKQQQRSITTNRTAETRGDARNKRAHFGGQSYLRTPRYRMSPMMILMMTTMNTIICPTTTTK
jgi:hypothetical protein